MSECVMRWVFVTLVEKVHRTYARWAKQYGKKGTVKRQKKQSQTTAGVGGF